jgi:hypothetical protein
MRWLANSISLIGLAVASQAHAAVPSSFVIDDTLLIDGTGYGAGSIFSIGSAGQSLDLVVTATSGGSLDDLVLYALTTSADFTLVDASRLVARSSFAPVGGGYGLNYSYSGLGAGQYALDVFASPGTSVRVAGQAAVSAVPEAASMGLAMAGALVALAAARLRSAA